MSTHILSPNPGFRGHGLANTETIERPIEPQGPSSEIAAAQAVLLGESLAVRRLRAQVERIGPYFRTAIVRGEAGTGKRLIAQTLQEASPLRDGPFVACRASALAAAAATEASAGDAITLIDSARGGVLYLEEVADVPHSLQPALLKVLQLLNREMRPPMDRGYGLGLRPQPVPLPRGEIRLVAATTRELRTLAAVGQFRPDLQAHLSVVELVAPALRQRMEDLPLLAEWLLRRLSVRTGLTQKVLSGSAGAGRDACGRAGAGPGDRALASAAAGRCGGTERERTQQYPTAGAAAGCHPPARGGGADALRRQQAARGGDAGHQPEHAVSYARCRARRRRLGRLRTFSG
jgi:hypothetical protein